MGTNYLGAYMYWQISTLDGSKVRQVHGVARDIELRMIQRLNCG